MALLTLDARFAFRILAKFVARFERTLAQRGAKEFVPPSQYFALMERDGIDDAEMYFTPFRPGRNLRCRSGTCGRAKAKNRVVLCLNRQRYDREGNACKERTHAEKH